MNTKALSFALGLGLALSSVTACAPVDDDNTGSDPGHLRDSNSASLPQRQRAALVSGGGRRCTATIIGPRHVLTAASCRFEPNALVRFYTNTSAEFDLSIEGRVEAVLLPSGVNPGATPPDVTDSSGNFADYAVLRLRQDIPTTSRVAVMEWLYPGDDARGVRVGAGNHYGEFNPAGELRTNNDETASNGDNSGSFLTKAAETDVRDEGGPFYLSAGSRVLGVFSRVFEYQIPRVTSGGVTSQTVRQDQYTSVPRHLASILSRIDYRGPFTVTTTGGVPVSFFESFPHSSAVVCRYACEHTSLCRAYSWVPGGQTAHPTATCYLREFSTGAVTPVVAGSVTGVRQ